MKNVVLQLMFEFGFPWTDVSVERSGKDVILTFTKGNERTDVFRYGWNGSGFVLLGIVKDSMEIEEFVAFGDIGAMLHKFLIAVGKALTEEKQKADV